MITNLDKYLKTEKPHKNLTIQEINHNIKTKPLKKQIEFYNNTITTYATYSPVYELKELEWDRESKQEIERLNRKTTGMTHYTWIQGEIIVMNEEQTKQLLRNLINEKILKTVVEYTYNGLSWLNDCYN